MQPDTLKIQLLFLPQFRLDVYLFGLNLMTTLSKLSICHSRREKRNKVFGKIAEKGKTSMGWFFGFKLHMIINDVGQIMAIKITKGNVDDRTPVEELTKKLKGSVYANKVYIGADLFKALYKRGLKLITGIKKI